MTWHNHKDCAFLFAGTKLVGAVILREKRWECHDMRAANEGATSGQLIARRADLNAAKEFVETEVTK